MDQGNVGNRTIGSAAAGGMLLGTVFGVMIIPGLYYIFAKISAKHILVKDEEENPLPKKLINMYRIKLLVLLIWTCIFW